MDNFAQAGPGRIAVLGRKMISKYEYLSDNSILTEDGSCNRTTNHMPEVNEPLNVFKHKKVGLKEWPSQWPDLNLTEVLLILKRAIHARHPKNIAKLKQFCQEKFLTVVQV